MQLDTAINWLKENYELALKNDYVKDKVAWSLYITWRQVEQDKSSNEYRKKRYCDRCGVLLTNENNTFCYEICDKCNEELEKEVKHGEKNTLYAR